MEDVLKHHGILGQKWGVRRYQNANGSLTSAGKRRYASDNEREIKSKKNLKASKQVDIGDLSNYLSRVTSDSEFKKRAAITAALATPIAIAGGYSMARSGRLGMNAMRGSYALHWKMLDAAEAVGLWSLDKEVAKMKW